MAIIEHDDWSPPKYFLINRIDPMAVIGDDD
jgi:hypothetical protein